MRTVMENKLPTSIAFIIFGASGDLTHRKLMPALYALFREKRLPKDFFILGVSRTRYTDESFRDHFLDTLSEHEDKMHPEDSVKTFLSHLHYLVMNPAEIEGYTELKKRLKKLDEEQNVASNYIYYLSTPPALYSIIPQHLHQCGLSCRGKSCGEKGIRRIVIEKPFGYDLATAKKLNQLYQKVFTEEQLFRIDHYLGKETVQNILALRFSNGIFEPLWNRRYIDHIEVTAVENLGIVSRGGFYDKTGALRDMVQNHLIQLLALVAMEPPVVFNATSFRDEIVKVYQSLRPLTEANIQNDLVRGQYVSSLRGKQQLKAYREEDKVDPESRTETFVALKLHLDNWRWSGVPFYIRTGKQMPTKVSEIVVHFQKTPHQVFGEAEANKLIIRIQPNEGVVLKFDMKLPGSGFTTKQVSMDFSYTDLNNTPIGDAYSRLIEDCMKGDQTLFTRSDAVVASWEYFTPILKYWEKYPETPLYGYPAGTWGPHEADQLMEQDKNWTNPCKNLSNTDEYCEL